MIDCIRRGSTGRWLRAWSQTHWLLVCWRKGKRSPSQRWMNFWTGISKGHKNATRRLKISARCSSFRSSWRWLTFSEIKLARENLTAPQASSSEGWGPTSLRELWRTSNRSCIKLSWKSKRERACSSPGWSGKGTMKCRKAKRRVLRKVQRRLFRCRVGMASQVWMCSIGCLKIVRRGTKLRVESMMLALISGLPVDEGSTFSPLWMTNEPRRKVLSRASITRVMRTLCLTTCNLWNGRPRAADDIRTRPTIHWDRARSWSNRAWSSAS